MEILKCKMCGGTLLLDETMTTGICEFCGTTQTVPKLNDEKHRKLYDRASHYFRNHEYDKALGIYEQILDENDEDAESYWSIILCKYGIEYVDDPVSHEKKPTIHRTQLTSIFDDENYKSALKYADISQKVLYEKEATAINELQKKSLAILQDEEPFDVFISYKETDENGKRTHDSVMANELYHELTQEGFKVFFAPITLESKLGTEYEPYIFSALKSARVMVVLGSKKEYFNATWVRNEWSRYLSFIKDGEKKALIPAYRDMDPYDLPKEFSNLQAQDMNKLGFMPDLVRGIRKLVGVQTMPLQQSGPYSQPMDSTLYNVRLLSVGNNETACIEAVREALNLSWKDAQNIVKSKNKMLSCSVKAYEVERIKNSLLRNGFEVGVEEVGGSTQSAVNSSQESGDIEKLFQRTALFLEGGEWSSASDYCEKILDIDPYNADAYIYKLLAKLHLTKEEDLVNSNVSLDGMTPYVNALKFADNETVKKLIGYNNTIKKTLADREKARREQERREIEERAERAKKEDEERQKKEKERQEVRELENAKGNIERAISTQINEKEQLQARILQIRKEMQNAEDQKKLRNISLLVLLSAVVCIALFTGVALSLKEAESLDGPLVAGIIAFLVSGILYMIFSAIMLKKDGKSLALVLVNLLTNGIFTFAIAFTTLFKTLKSTNIRGAKDINKMNAQINELETKINASTISLNEVVRKITEKSKSD